MIGLILLYFIGKRFYTLAETHKQNKWLFAVLGVVTYYAGTLVFGVILGVIDGILELGVDWDNNILMVLFALPIGLLSCYVFYYLLEKNWSKKEEKQVLSIEDIGKSED